MVQLEFHEVPALRKRRDFVACGHHQVLHVGGRDDKAGAELHQVADMGDVGADAADAEHLFVRLAGHRNALEGGTDFRMLEFTGNAQRGGEIIGADQQHVDAGHRGDGVGVGDALRRLQHRDQRRQRVALRVDLAERRGAVALQRARPGDGTFADRRETAGIGKGDGLLARRDVRADYAERAGIEQPRRVLKGVAGDARQRRDADAERRGANLRRGVERDRRVLHVDEEGVEATGVGDHGDVGAARQPRRHAQRHLAAGKSLLQAAGDGHDGTRQLR